MTSINSWSECLEYIKSDLFRYFGACGVKCFIRGYWIPGFRYTMWLRICQWSSQNSKIVFLFSRFLLRHYSIKYGIMIPYQTTIGKDLYIGHFSCIVINEACILGKNINISHGVTLGAKNGGKNAGVPILGDKVYIGAGAKIIGSCHIGNGVVIGANSVVTQSFPENAVVAGIPASVLSYEGSVNYVGSFKDEDL